MHYICQLEMVFEGLAKKTSNVVISASFSLNLNGSQTFGGWTRKYREIQGGD